MRRSAFELGFFIPNVMTINDFGSHVTGRKVTNAERFDLKLGAPRLPGLNQYYVGCLKISERRCIF